MKEDLGSLSTYTGDQRNEALRRFYILQPHLEDQVSLTQIASSQQVSVRTLQRWVQNYHQSGLVGLIRKNRTDRGTRRIPQSLLLLIEGLLLKETPPSIASIHRQVEEIAKQKEWNPPSYSCTYNVVQNLRSSIKTLAHDGTKMYKEKFDIIFRREADGPNQIWQADHTLLDIWIFNEKNQLSRPWLTIIIDDYSRAIVGYYLSFQSPSAIQTALALHQAIWRKGDSKWPICGIPEVFYTDHGSDFTSKHMEQVSANIKMRLVFSTIGVPRGRGKIERFFQTVNQLFLNRLPGFISSPQKYSTPTMNLTDLECKLREFILHDYHHRRHSSTQMTPYERWSQNGFLPQMPESLDELDLLLLTVAKSRIVHSDGIRFKGFRYMDVNLAAYVGEQVTIRYNPRDLAEIHVYYQEQFLCRAICPELSGTQIRLKDIVYARDQRKKELSKAIKDRTSFADKALGNEPLEESDPFESKSQKENNKKSTLKRYYHE